MKTMSVLQWFTELQWVTLMHQPLFILLDLAIDFYVGVPPKSKNTPEPNFSIVRDRMVSSAAERINEV